MCINVTILMTIYYSFYKFTDLFYKYKITTVRTYWTTADDGIIIIFILNLRDKLYSTYDKIIYGLNIYMYIIL